MNSVDLRIPQQIGPAWLLLQHGPFAAAIVATTTIGMVAPNIYLYRLVAIYVLAMGIIVIPPWTIYAILGTWRENKKVKNPTYGDFGFKSLITLVVLVSLPNFVLIIEIIRTLPQTTE